MEVQTLSAHDFSLEKLRDGLHPLAEGDITNQDGHVLHGLADLGDFQDHFDHDSFFDGWKVVLDGKKCLLLCPVVDQLIEIVIESL